MKSLSSTLAALAGESFGARFLRIFIVPLGVAVVVSWIIASVAEPRWVAPGWAYYHGYGKNFEVLSILGGLGAGAGAVLLGRRPGFYFFLCPVGLLGIGIAAYHIRGPALTLASTGSFLLLLAALLLALGTDRGEEPGKGERASFKWTHGLCVLVLAVLTFLVHQRSFRVIDTYHMGQVLLSAVNLVRGGVPFETFFFPHGLHDAGVAALWIAITGKIGTSAVALTYATKVAIGAVAFYALSYRVLGSLPVAFAVTALVVLLDLVLGVSPNEPLLRRFEAFLTIPPLGAFHVWVFVILAFCTLSSGYRFRHFLTGVALGLGILWRLEIGIYGLVALGGLLAYRDLVAGPPSGQAWMVKSRSFLRHACSLLAGVAVCFGLAYVVLGWPNPFWFDVVLRLLPTYYADSWGLPFPTVHAREPFTNAALSVTAYGSLVLVMILIFMALHVAQRTYSRSEAPAAEADGPRRHHHAEVLVFLALAGALSLKTALGRSDIPHVLFSTPFLVMGSLLLVAALAQTRFGWTPLKTFLVVVIVVLFVNARKGEIRLPRPVPSWERVGESFRVLGEHLSPNPPVGACADRMYAPSEARAPNVRAFIEATCEVEEMFRENGIRRFVIDHSAPWYYVRFGVLPLPTRHYILGGAITPGMQRQLIGDLRKSRPQALLKVKGYGALRAKSSVPNGIMIPMVEAYLQERRKGVKPIQTAIGDLYPFDNPKHRLAPPPAVPFSPVPLARARKEIRLFVDSLVYAPSGFLIGRGWAAEWRGRWAESLPLERLFLYQWGAPVGELTYGLPRPGVAEFFQNPSLTRVGWNLDLLVHSPDLDGSSLGVRALLADGRVVDFRLNVSKLRRLPRLQGKEWSSLPSAVREARRLAQDLSAPRNHTSRRDAELLKGRAPSSP